MVASSRGRQQPGPPHPAGQSTRPAGTFSLGGGSWEQGAAVQTAWHRAPLPTPRCGAWGVVTPGRSRALRCAGESWSRASGRFRICKLSGLTPASSPGLGIMQVLAQIQGRPVSSLRPPGCAQGWVGLAQDTRPPRAFDAKEGIPTPPQSSLRASLSDGKQAGWGSVAFVWGDSRI